MPKPVLQPANSKSSPQRGPAFTCFYLRPSLTVLLPQSHRPPKCTSDSVHPSLSKLREIVIEREAWCAQNRGREELPHTQGQGQQPTAPVRGQEWRPGGATLRLRSGCGREETNRRHTPGAGLLPRAGSCARGFTCIIPTAPDNPMRQVMLALCSQEAQPRTTQQV